MANRLNPYISFKDNARQAMEFYQSVLGGKLEINTFEEFQASKDPAENDKVMHAMLTTDDGMVLMASDTPNSMEYQPGSSISVSISGDDEAMLRGYFEKLAEGGTVVMPFEKAPWSDAFGMLTDKFGIDWMVNASSPTSDGQPAAQQA